MRIASALACAPSHQHPSGWHQSNQPTFKTKLQERVDSDGFGIPPIDPLPIKSITKLIFHRELSSEVRRHLIWFVAKSIIPNANIRIVNERCFREFATYCQQFELDAFTEATCRNEYFLILAQKLQQLEEALVAEIVTGIVEEDIDDDGTDSETAVGTGIVQRSPILQSDSQDENESCGLLIEEIHTPESVEEMSSEVNPGIKTD